MAQKVKIHLQCGKPGLNPWVQQIPWKRKWQPTPISCLKTLYGQRSLVGYNPLPNDVEIPGPPLLPTTLYLIVPLFQGVNDLSVQFSSVAQSCPTLCDPMNRSTPGLPVHHQLLEFTQTHVHRVSDHPEGLSKGPSKGKTCSQLENGGRVINKNKQKPNYQLNCKNMKDQI